MPARFARAAAEGTIKKLVVFIIVFAGVIGLLTWYEPFAQGYELKNAAKIACNELLKNWRYKIPNMENAHVEPFLRRATQAGVKLKPTQYKLTPSHDKALHELVCKVEIGYSTSTDWFMVGPIFVIKPLKQKHLIRFEHRVRDSY